MINKQFDLLNQYKIFKDFKIKPNKDISFENDYCIYYINNKKQNEFCISLYIKDKQMVNTHVVTIFIEESTNSWTYIVSMYSDYIPESFHREYSIMKIYNNQNITELLLLQSDFRKLILQYIKLYNLNKINIDKTTHI